MLQFLQNERDAKENNNRLLAQRLTIEEILNDRIVNSLVDYKKNAFTKKQKYALLVKRTATNTLDDNKRVISCLNV